MDEQGIYCPRCGAYVHFWFIPSGGRALGSGSDERPARGTLIEMPQACGQCAYKGSYRTSDLRTRRGPTDPSKEIVLGPKDRNAAVIDLPLRDDDKTPGPV